MSKIFIYQWFTEDENDKIQLKGYGINEKGEDVFVLVEGFEPWIVMEVNRNFIFSKSFISDLTSEYPPSNMYSLQDMGLQKKLYFDHGKQLFKFKRLRTKSIQVRKQLYYKLKDNKRFRIHEYEASPLLQFLCKYRIPSCGWVEITNISRKKVGKRTDSSIEYRCNVLEIQAVKNPEEYGVPEMRCLSFDLETYSSNELKLPDPTLESDVIFQIGMTTTIKQKEKNILLSLSKKKFDLENIEVHLFEDECELLDYFCKFVKTVNPHILMGYNIFGFDIPYLKERCELHDIPLSEIGMEKDVEAEYREIKWSSSAYSKQEFHYYDYRGRISLDLLPVVKRDYKLSNYKLKTVSTFFLGETKDPLSVKDIFEAYRLGVLGGNVRKIKLCGKYCVQDARLVTCLFEKLQMWIGLLEMARICNVGVMTLFTQGQQIKVFSQIYKKCFLENRVVDSFDALTIPKNIQFTFENYCGAFVFPPIPGKYS